MPDKYVPREVGEVYAEKWIPGDPDAVKNMLTWMYSAGIRVSFVCEDDWVEMQLWAPSATTFKTGDYMLVSPGEYVIARDSKFESIAPGEFAKAFRKEFSDV